MLYDATNKKKLGKFKDECEDETNKRTTIHYFHVYLKNIVVNLILIESTIFHHRSSTHVF